MLVHSLALRASAPDTATPLGAPVYPHFRGDPRRESATRGD